MNKKDFHDVLAEFYQGVIRKEMASKKDLDSIHKRLVDHNGRFEVIESKLDAHTKSLMTIEKEIGEKEIGVFRDALSDIRDNREKIKVLEQKAHTHL